MALNVNRGSVNSYDSRKIVADEDEVLSANETYSTGWISSEEFSKISGTVYVEGGNGDLYVDEAYGDSGPARVVNGPTSVTSGSAEKLSQQVDNKFVQLRFVNGGSNLTVFEIYFQLR